MKRPLPQLGSQEGAESGYVQTKKANCYHQDFFFRFKQKKNKKKEKKKRGSQHEGKLGTVSCELAQCRT